MSATEVLIWIKVLAIVIELVRGHEDKTPREMAQEIIPVLPIEVQADICKALDEIEKSDIVAITSVLDFLSEVVGKKNA